MAELLGGPKVLPREEVAKIGPFKATVDEQKTTQIPPALSITLLLAGIGVYGVISYLVSQRRQEIGIRIALGATMQNVLSMVLLRGARLAAFGILAGILGALALTRLISSVLFEVSAFDPATFAIGVVVLIVLILLACWLPARRAAKIDPIITLRYE